MCTVTARPFDTSNNYGGPFGASSSTGNMSVVVQQLLTLEFLALTMIMTSFAHASSSGQPNFSNASYGGSQGSDGMASDVQPASQSAVVPQMPSATGVGASSSGTTATDTGNTSGDSAIATSSSSASTPVSISAPVSTSNSSAPAGGFADQWNTVRFTNTTNEPMTVQLTMGAGQSLPAGVGGNGQFTIAPGTSKDLTFADNGPGFNFKSTKGDGSAWNQGEVTFTKDAAGGHSTAFDMSYIYGFNQRMNIYSSDGRASGYQGDLLANAPANVKVGGWGIQAPLGNGRADASGPQAPDSDQAAYLYHTIPEGMGYVGVGRPAEQSDYDDKSTLQTSGSLAVVFS